MKKLVSYLCVITLILGLQLNVHAADTNNPLITISDISAEAGKSVEVPITLSNNTGICGAMLDISYDTALVLEDVKAGDAFSSMTFTTPGNLSANPVKLVWDSMEEDKSNGSIAILTFKAPSNGGTYHISASYEEGNIVDGNLNPVDVTIVNGSVTVKSAAQESQFTDVPSTAYYYDAVNWAVEKGITTGKTATTFEPDGKCTRAQVVTFLWRAAGEPEPENTTNSFTDINSSKYYYKAVLWAVENNITTGKTATTFEPDTECTRAQVVTFMWRAEGKPEPESLDNKFTDVSESDYYYKAVLWAVENGITNGRTSTVFDPLATCTRAQVVTFLYRYYKQ